MTLLCSLMFSYVLSYGTGEDTKDTVVSTTLNLPPLPERSRRLRSTAGFRLRSTTGSLPERSRRLRSKKKAVACATACRKRVVQNKT